MSTQEQVDNKWYNTSWFRLICTMLPIIGVLCIIGYNVKMDSRGSSKEKRQFAEATTILLRGDAERAAASLTWTPSVEPGITGYRIRYGLTPRNQNCLNHGDCYPNVMEVGLDSNEVSIPLTLGTWYFSMSSVSAIGIEGLFSNEVTIVISDSPTPTPAPLMTIGGTIRFCGTQGPVAGVTVTLSGSVSSTALTDASGNYSFSIPFGSTYAVIPSKAPLPFGSPAISTVDVVAVMNYYLSGVGLACPEAADVTLDGVVMSHDIIAMQRFTLMRPGFASTGKYRFTAVPPTLDFTAVLLGDVQ